MSPSYLARRRAAFAEANAMLERMGPIPGLGVGSNPVRLSGLGADAGSTALSFGTPLASGGLAVATGASLATAGITAGVGLVVAAIALWLGRRGPKQKVATTQIVNEAEPLLRQNLAAWNASPKGCADQAASLSAALQVWYAVVSACCNQSLGDPGHSCLDDRLPAGVQFQCQPGAFHISGNGRFDWFNAYVLPIVTDPAASGCCPSQIFFDPSGTAAVPMPACTPNPSSLAGASAALAALAGSGSVAGVPIGVVLVLALLGLGVWLLS